MTTLNLFGLEIRIDEDVYEPSEDSFLLAEGVDALPNERALDLCTGTGLAALAAAARGARTLATDVNPAACRLATENARANELDLDVLLSNLARGVHARFELLTCNPPYLPTAPEDRVPGIVHRALDGGADGAEVTRRVIDELDRLLSPSRDARALLIVSTLQPLDDLRERAKARGFTWHPEGSRSFGLETLQRVRLTRR